MDRAIKRHQECATELNNVNQRIKALESCSAEPIVSEHAILRYIERGMQFDIEQIRGNILSEKVRACIDTLGNGKFPIGNGLFAVVKDRTIVTVED